MYHIQLAVIISSIALLDGATATPWETLGDVSSMDPMFGQINSWGPVSPADSDFFTTDDFPAIGTTHYLKKKIPVLTSDVHGLPLNAYFRPVITPSPFELNSDQIGFTGPQFFSPLRTQIPNFPSFPLTNTKVSPLMFLNHRLNADHIRSPLKPILYTVKSSHAAPERLAATSPAESPLTFSPPAGSTPSSSNVVATVSSSPKPIITSSASKVIKTIPTISVSEIEKVLVQELTPVVKSLVSDVADSFLHSVIHEVSVPIVKTISRQLAPVVLTSYFSTSAKSLPIISIGSFTQTAPSVKRLHSIAKRTTTPIKLTPPVVDALPTLNAVAEGFQKQPHLTSDGAVAVANIATTSSNPSRGSTVSEIIRPTIQSFLSPLITNLRLRLPSIISQRFL